MASWRERLKAYKAKHGGGAGHGYAKGIKGSGIGVAAGGAAFFAAGQLSNHIAFLRKSWYVTPAAIAVAGHILKSKGHHDAGLALLGAAGALGVMGYLTNAGQSVGQGQQATGFTIGDAGALQTSDDAFRNLGEAGAYPALYATQLDQSIARARGDAMGDASDVAGDAGDAGALIHGVMGLDS